MLLLLLTLELTKLMYTEVYTIVMRVIFNVLTGDARKKKLLFSCQINYSLPKLMWRMAR